MEAELPTVRTRCWKAKQGYIVFAIITRYQTLWQIKWFVSVINYHRFYEVQNHFITMNENKDDSNTLSV